MQCFFIGLVHVRVERNFGREDVGWSHSHIAYLDCCRMCVLERDRSGLQHCVLEPPGKMAFRMC